MNEKAAPQPSPEFLARYAVGVKRLADDLGLPETEVRTALEFKPGRTPDCLRPEEVENFARLSAERRAHIQMCESCRELELAMNAAPSKTDLDWAVDLATDDARCPSCGQRRQPESRLQTWFGNLGISDEMVANLRTHMQNVDVEEYLNDARDYLQRAGSKATSYAKENPGKVAAGVAVMAVGAGLLISALNRD